MYNITNREKLLSGVILILVLVISGTFYMSNKNSSEIVLSEDIISADEKIIEEQSVEPQKSECTDIVVYICGCVNNPGVYSIGQDMRVNDLVLLAGGFGADADLSSVNLAKKLFDEDKVYIPKKGEKIEETQAIVQSQSVNTPKSNKININTATLSELDTLPGVGPAYAQNIIDYRNTNGNFKTTDEIKNVSGIGDKRYESIKDLITVR